MPNYHHFSASDPLLKDSLRFSIKTLTGPHTVVSVVGQDISWLYLRVPDPKTSHVLSFYIGFSVQQFFLTRFHRASPLIISFNFIMTSRTNLFSKMDVSYWMSLYVAIRLSVCRSIKIVLISYQQSAFILSDSSQHRIFLVVN